jgi:2-succinyl-6-hydroxy-2,4-cyclohexadiene-1-carboxylate synthase
MSEPPLVLLHGFTGCGANWALAGATAVFPPLLPNIQLITPDIIGHGRAPAPHDPTPYTMPSAAEQIVQNLAQQNIQRIHLLGYSMGGRLALYIARHYPHLVQSLILESSSPGLATEAERAARRQQDEALAERIEREGIPAFVAYWESLPLWQSQTGLDTAVRQALHAQRLANQPHALAHSLRQMGTGAQPSLWAELPQLTLPILLLTGELDPKFCHINQQMAAQLPHATWHVVPQAGHAVHLEQPLVYASFITEFLTPLTPALSPKEKEL